MYQYSDNQITKGLNQVSPHCMITELAKGIVVTESEFRSPGCGNTVLRNLVTSLLSFIGQLHVVLCVPCEISRRVLQRKPHGFFKKKNNQGILRNPIKTGFNSAEA